jgi:FdhE protein
LRREPLPTAVADAIERLGRLAEARPELSDAAAIQSVILRTAYAQPPQAGPLRMSPERAAAKRAEGMPLLRGEALSLDMPAVEGAILRLCKAIARRLDQPQDASAIAGAIARQELVVADMVRQTLDGETGALRERAAERGLNGQLLGTLLRFSLFPALEQLATQLAPLRALAPWQPGYCPTCGSWPLLSEYRGLEQARFLRCGLCASEWSLDRLLCPFCGCRDHQQLGYLHVEGDQQKRAATCTQCGCYTKALATLARIPAIELAVDDLATIHLDIVALERGYSSPR